MIEMTSTQLNVLIIIIVISYLLLVCETTAGIEIRDPEPHKMLSMKNNVIQGGSRYGYWIPGELCNEERFYTNNSAGSVYTGIVVVSNIS